MQSELLNNRGRFQGRYLYAQDLANQLEKAFSLAFPTRPKPSNLVVSSAQLSESASPQKSQTRSNYTAFSSIVIDKLYIFLDQQNLEKRERPPREKLAQWTPVGERLRELFQLSSPFIPRRPTHVWHPVMTRFLFSNDQSNQRMKPCSICAHLVAMIITTKKTI